MRETDKEQNFKYRGIEVKLWRNPNLGYIWVLKCENGDTFGGYDKYKNFKSYKNARQHIKNRIIKLLKDG